MFTKRLERRLRGLLALAGLVVLVLPVTSSSQVLPGLPGASVTVCQVTGSASAPQFAEVQVAADQVAAYLNQFPGSFVGSCPEAGSNSGSPSGAVRVCRVSGSATAPVLSEVLVAVDQVNVFLAQNPGSFVGACPATSGGGNAGQGGTGTGPLSAVVTVCRVTGSASAPQLAQLNLEVDRVAAFLNQNPGSFIGTCPGEGGTVTSGPGRILGIPVGAALSICRVTAAGGVLRYEQVNVAIERVAAYLNQHYGSFVGLCPGGGDPNGTAGTEPIGFVTICRVVANGEGLVPITIRRDELHVYLAQPGTIVPAPLSGCPAVRQGPGPEDRPTTITPGETRTITVETTPNTVVTATGAGVKETTKSNKKGKAKVKVTPKRTGVITVRAAGGKAVKRVGVAAKKQSAAGLTG
jgi:hypothetical protein